LQSDKKVQELVPLLEGQVAEGRITGGNAADTIIRTFFNDSVHET